MKTVEYFGMLTSLQETGMPFDVELLINDPVPALSYIKEQHGSLDAFKCPSVVNHLKNTYYITSPIDFTIERIGDDHWRIKNSRAHTTSLKRYFHLQMPESQRVNDSICMNFGLQYYFVNNGDDITMEVIDPPLCHLQLTNMCGEFNISKWFRPTNFTFFLDPSLDEVSFKRGQPLYAVRFRAGGDTVKLSRIDDLERRERLLYEQMRATTLKEFYPGLKLEQMYELFKTNMKRIFK